MSDDDEQAPRDKAQLSLAARSSTLRSALARFFQRRLSNDSEVEDLVQEVFLRIIKRGEVSDLDHLEGYAFVTAQSVLRDRSRRRRARSADRHVPFDPNQHAQTDLDPERMVAGQEALWAMTRVILGMPERARTVFILRRIEGLPYAEIAKRLGVSLSTVEKDLQRAVEFILAKNRERRP